MIEIRLYDVSKLFIDNLSNNKEVYANREFTHLLCIYGNYFNNIF